VQRENTHKSIKAFVITVMITVDMALQWNNLKSVKDS